MVQEATQHLVALYLKRGGWLGGIIKAKWNDIAQPFVRPVAVMVGLNFAQSSTVARDGGRASTARTTEISTHATV